MAIKIIDSVMGSGKTQWAIQNIIENKDKPFIFIKPLINDDDTLRICERIRKAGVDVEMPSLNDKHLTKSDSLKELVQDGRNILCSHELYKRISEEVAEAISKAGYTIYIDEAMSVLTSYKKISAKDIEIMQGMHLISVETLDTGGRTHRVKWIDNKYNEGLFQEFRWICEMTDMYLYGTLDKCVVLSMCPWRLFSGGNDIYILTYLFDSSYMKQYLAMNQQTRLPKYSVKRINGRCIIVPYEKPTGEIYRDKIHFVEPYKREAVIERARQILGDDQALSKNWYIQNAKKNSKPFKQLLSGIKGVYRQLRYNKKNLMWTTYTSSRGIFEDAKGYNLSHKTFVSCNAKGSNDYRDKYNLLYLINRYANPVYSRFFQICTGKQFDDDLFALSEMIQWIWRSRIRNHRGKTDVYIYMPSARMRKILESWLNGEM